MGWLTTQRNETLRDKGRRKILKAVDCGYCHRPVKGSAGMGKGIYHPKCAQKAAARW